MSVSDIKLSPQFKSQTTKAIVSIVFFVLTYIVLFLLAIVLTVACVYGGYLLVVNYPRLLTVILGLGLASMGFLILFFLIKFLFKSHKVDRSHLVEITENEEPKLFAMIREIVDEVGTTFPKKVYLSSDINAAVFYDSSFWSMFFPIKKNLQIGMGLVNCVTTAELKAILAHEFGHFSQDTMKVGSYVYNVNQVIFNMLQDNEGYDKFIQSWAGMSDYIAIFVVLAVKIVEGIQWILGKLYAIVNKSYMALSREMEFHADEVAAHVTGYRPLKSSLLRLDLAENAFNSVLSFYGENISGQVRSENLFRDHSFAMDLLAERGGLSTKNNFPDVPVEELNRFNKSKLVIENQWASHPSTEDRINRLEATNLVIDETDNSPANNVFSDIEKSQKLFTDRIFANPDPNGKVLKTVASSQFKQEFVEKYENDAFPKMYNGYYDARNMESFDLENLDAAALSEPEELFSGPKVDEVLQLLALENDIVIIEHIGNKMIPVKSFDYDGRKYKRKECTAVIAQLKAEIDSLKETLRKNDISVYKYFKSLEEKKGSPRELKKLYEAFFAYDKEYDRDMGLYTEINAALQFINVTTPFEQIDANFKTIYQMEKKLKSVIAGMLKDSNYENEITPAIRENFELYLPKDLTYFAQQRYFDENLEILFIALNNYGMLLSKKYFLLKRKILKYQEGLI